MTLRSRIDQYLSDAEAYAIRERNHAVSRSTNGEWLSGHARGQLSIIHDLQFMLKKSDPSKDCKPEPENSDAR